MLISDAIDLLRTYNNKDELTLHKGADESLLLKVENTYNITLPDDFKTFYRFSNGFTTVEDIFNMIPLEGIIDDKNKYNEDCLYIAEYMVYSDMWQLEINPNNCNDYKIIVQSNYNQLMLTYSLGQFIERFLNGGVFESGGLYEWQEEVESQPIYTTKIKTTEPLLMVFYYGLKYNLISKKEVVDWADKIVMYEDEPESFFIDLSLSHDKNDLMSLLHSKCIPDNHVTARAILGLLYHRLLNGAINVVDAISIMDKHIFSGLLPKETEQISDMTDVIWMDELIFYNQEISQKALNFLAHYKNLEVSNYKKWLGLSYHIEYRFTEEANKSNAEKPIRADISKIKISIIYYVVYAAALISLIVLITTYIAIKNGSPINKFRSDLYQLSQLYIFFFICYYVIKITQWMVKRFFSLFFNN